MQSVAVYNNPHGLCPQNIMTERGPSRVHSLALKEAGVLLLLYVRWNRPYQRGEVPDQYPSCEGRPSLIRSAIIPLSNGKKRVDGHVNRI